MPPSIRPLTYRETASKLRNAGFIVASQKGSHVKFYKETDAGTLTAIVPRHRELAVGTLRSIMRQANLTPEEFQSL